MYSFFGLWESKSKHNPYQTSNSNKAHQRKLIDPESQLPVYFSGIIVRKFRNRNCASESIIDLKMFVHFNIFWIPTVGNLTESGTTPETRSSHVEFKQFVRTRMILPLVGLISMVSKSRVAVQDLKNFFLAFGLDGLEVLPVQETSCWKKGNKRNWISKMNLPWKSKTKQRMIFRIVHIKDSLLPMGKVWSWTPWVCLGDKKKVYALLPGTCLSSILWKSTP